MEEIRKLSTILFADIAGYTSMMQKDEQHALGLLNQFKEIIEAHVPEYQGNIVQYFGDACLLSFESVTNGMACALALQLSLIKQKIPVRIGMHLGEVVFRNNNAFGDGVNIASRIESMGVAGSVIVSKVIHDQFKNKSDFRLISLGSYHFKNVDAPIQIYALANDGLVIPKHKEMKGKLQDVPGNFFQRLWRKRVPQILTVYILIAWLGMQLFDWALNQFHISPHWAQIFFITVIGAINCLLISNTRVNALLLNAKSDRLIKKAKPFLRLSPNNDGLLFMVFKAHMVDQNWTEALDILQIIKLKRPEINPQLALMEKSIHYQRDHANAPGQYKESLLRPNIFPQWSYSPSLRPAI